MENKKQKNIKNLSAYWNRMKVEKNKNDEYGECSNKYEKYQAYARNGKKKNDQRKRAKSEKAKKSNQTFQK